MTKKLKKPELLAPAGNLEKMKTAFAFGADAVYAGIPDFSLRVRINDFTITSLGKAIKYAHKIDKKVYVTVNIFAHNKHIEKLPSHIKKLKKIKPDGIFISDPGVIAVIKKSWPSANIILSTQANCTNWRAAKFWKDQGFSRLILARDVDLKEVIEIKKKVPGVELETFVHGALCMAYSGRCFISKHMTGRNANLGDCVQPCRWKYNIKSENHGELELVEEEHGSYILNSEDLCLIKRTEELIKAGISAFKIEGRAKSVYYLASVIGAYRKAIDMFYDNKLSSVQIKKELNFLYKELDDKLYHRGYTEGFMFGVGEGAQNLDNSHKTPDWEFCGQAIESTKDEERSKKFLTKIRVHNSLKVGDKIEIIVPDYDIIKMSLTKIIDVKTGKEVKEAHGGQKKEVIIETNKEVPEFSVLRRKVN